MRGNSHRTTYKISFVPLILCMLFLFLFHWCQPWVLLFLPFDSFWSLFLLIFFKFSNYHYVIYIRSLQLCFCFLVLIRHLELGPIFLRTTLAMSHRSCHTVFNLVLKHFKFPSWFLSWPTFHSVVRYLRCMSLCTFYHVRCSWYLAQSTVFKIFHTFGHRARASLNRCKRIEITPCTLSGHHG